MRSERDIEDVYLQRIVELHELFDSLSDLVYQHCNDLASNSIRYKECRKKFCMSLIKLGLVGRSR